MKILVSGSSGLIGSTLIPFLTGGGRSVTPLVRSRERMRDRVRWDPAAGELDASRLEGFEGVVHLAGENIAAGRWSTEQKLRIRESRVRGTKLLAQTLARLERPPRVLVCASAIGYYGDRGHEVLTEDAPPGSGFLPEVCKEWEAATEAAKQAGIRVVNLRIGIVLSSKGGALAKMLPPFKAGVGGMIGNGRQYMSWVALDDVVGAIDHALVTDRLQGPVNVVSPHPATNQEFTKILGRVLSRPTLFPVPAFAARLAFGEMADALLLASQRVDASRLVASGYHFRFPYLEDILRHLLGRRK